MLLRFELFGHALHIEYGPVGTTELPARDEPPVYIPTPMEVRSDSQDYDWTRDFVGFVGKDDRRVAV